MRLTFLLLIVGILVGWSVCQFLNNRPFPTYSLESMPDTGFTCRDKILGGYYADPETQCQMFHICVKVAGIGVQDFRFLCPNGTAFDQDHQICADWDDVDCDATTLYYSSDNFDLYRLGSGFESKAVKYGEEEETFALQRAETGDARLNREHQAQRVNQQKQYQTQFARNRPLNNQNNHNTDAEKDIFKVSSSSNFYNNRNNGKELDDDDDGGNVNQNRDYVQKKKIIRKQQRRPQQQTAEQQQRVVPQSTTTQRVSVQQEQTQRPHRPTGFINNFAGSSYQTTTQNPASIVPSDVPRIRNSQRRVVQQQQSSSTPVQTNSDTFHQPLRHSTHYTVSSPAPFKQTQQTTSTENYPSNFPQKVAKQTTSGPFRVKLQSSSVEPINYATTAAVNNLKTGQVHYDVPKIVKTIIQAVDGLSPKLQPTKADNYPTTFAPKVKFDITKQQSHFDLNQPTTFAPRTNVAYTQNLNSRPFTNQQNQFNLPNINQQQTTQNINKLQNRQPTKQQTQNAAQVTNSVTQAQFNLLPHSQPFAKQFSQQQDLTTQKTTPFTQYTPTVPKVTSTTPVSRSNRFDETQYDDGSYNSKYDHYDTNGNPTFKDDEFLKAAHSQNIASSRNEFFKNAQQKSTQSQIPLVSLTTTKPFYNESPRPFSASPNTPKFTEYTKIATAQINQNQNLQQQIYKPQKSANVPQQQQQQQKPLPVVKQTKKDYDYAYYDSNADDYDNVDADIPKEFSKTK